MHQSAQKIEKFAQLSHLKATNSAVISQQNIHAVSLGSSTINAIHSTSANHPEICCTASHLSCWSVFEKSFHLFFRCKNDNSVLENFFVEWTLKAPQNACNALKILKQIKLFWRTTIFTAFCELEKLSQQLQRTFLAETSLKIFNNPFPWGALEFSL